MKKTPYATFIFILLVALSSCANLKVVADYKTDSVEPHKLNSVTYFWGLKSPTDTVVTCDSKSICQVKTTVRPLQAIVTVITLGIVIPQHIEWDCCPPPIKDSKLN